VKGRFGSPKKIDLSARVQSIINKQTLVRTVMDEMQPSADLQAGTFIAPLRQQLVAQLPARDRMKRSATFHSDEQTIITVPAVLLSRRRAIRTPQKWIYADPDYGRARAYTSAASV
jgi:hypothetical protein